MDRDSRIFFSPLSYPFFFLHINRRQWYQSWRLLRRRSFCVNETERLKKKPHLFRIKYAGRRAASVLPKHFRSGGRRRRLNGVTRALQIWIARKVWGYPEESEDGSELPSSLSPYWNISGHRSPKPRSLPMHKIIFNRGPHSTQGLNFLVTFW